MTPLERMAAAIGSTDISKPGWNLDAAHAAILALAEVDNSDLPDVNKNAETFSPFPDAFANARKDAFRRILLNLIEEPQSGDTNPSTRSDGGMTP